MNYENEYRDIKPYTAPVFLCETREGIKRDTIEKVKI